MAKLPRQPDLERLRALAPAVITLNAGTELHRIYYRGGAHPTRWNALRHFGPTGARFDHHLPDAEGRGQLQERGITYAAADILTCVAEVFQGTLRTIRRTQRSPWLVSFALESDVRLLDLTGTFALRAGASMKLMSGPVSYAQNWAHGFYEVYTDIHGLYYPSSMTNRPAVAFNERLEAVAVSPQTPTFHRALSDPLMLTRLRNAARELNYGLV